MTVDRPTFIFDFGKVLTLNPNQAIVDSMARLLGAPMAEYRKAYTEHRGEYDRGTLSSVDYWGLVAGDFGKRLASADVEALVKLDLESWFSTNHETISLVRELKTQGYKLFLLSNMNFAGKERFFSHNEWDVYFDDVILSCDLGLIKPEPAIYQHCLARAGARAEDCIFIDDTPANVRAAQNLGMCGIVFKDCKGLRSQLKDQLDSWSVQ